MKSTKEASQEHFTKYRGGTLNSSARKQIRIRGNNVTRVVYTGATSPAITRMDSPPAIPLFISVRASYRNFFKYSSPLFR